MALITLPSSPGFIDGARFELVRADGMLETMSGRDIYVKNIPAKWAFSFALPPMTLANSRAWRGALLQLTELDNYFRATPPDITGPSTGYLGAAPTVNGGGQIGKTLVLAGASASTAVFNVGDFFTINGELKMVTGGGTSNGSGALTVSFIPALKNSPSNATPIVVQNPYANFRLIDPRIGWSVQLPQLTRFAVTAIEVQYA